MGEIQVQSSLQAALVVLLLTFVLGGVIIASLYALVFRKRKIVQALPQSADETTLYLVFSRLSHQLKTAGEVIRVT